MPNPLTRKDIVEQIYSRHGGWTRRQAAVIVNQCIKIAVDGIVRDHQLKVPHLGTFRTLRSKGHHVVHPKSGELVEIKEHWRIAFRPSSKIKAQLRKPKSDER